MGKTTLCCLWVAVLLFSATAHAATVSVSCGAVGIELEVCREAAQAWAERTGNRVNIVSTPNSSTERLALYQQLLAARSPDIDLFEIDVIWPGILHTHFVDLTPYVPQAVLDAQFPAAVEASRIESKLVALPWFMDAGLLYYRKDLLERYGQEVPTTWEALTKVAAQVQAAERAAGNDRMWGYVWQGRAYEGLTCNALEWIASHGGGTIVEADGTVTVGNPRAVRAVELAASWVGTISPPGVLNYDEEQARGVFQTGNAVFMRNWPYAWPLLNGEDSPLRGRVGIAPLPKGGPDGTHVAALGGWQLAVSRYSRVKKEAIDLALYLTSLQEQKRRALVAGYNPTYRALYRDPELVAASPIFAGLFDVLEHAVARPSAVTGPRYNRVSHAFWNAVHAVLAKRAEAQPSLIGLEHRLKLLSYDGRW